MIFRRRRIRVEIEQKTLRILLPASEPNGEDPRVVPATTAPSPPGGDPERSPQPFLPAAPSAS